MLDDQAGRERCRLALFEDGRRTWDRTTALLAEMRRTQDDLRAGLAASLQLLREAAVGGAPERRDGHATGQHGPGPARARPAGAPGMPLPEAAVPPPAGRLLPELWQAPPCPAWGMPASPSPVGALPRMLREVHALLLSQLRTLLDGYQLSEPQWRVLQAAASGEASTVALLEATDLPVAALAGEVIELERRGLVTATPDDGTPCRVGLTGSGRHVQQAAAADLSRACSVMEVELGAGKAAQLYGLLALLAARLGGDGPPPDG